MRRISSIAFATSDGSRTQRVEHPGVLEQQQQALPIARVTVTWPAMIRSSGTPITTGRVRPVSSSRHVS